MHLGQSVRSSIRKRGTASQARGSWHVCEMTRNVVDLAVRIDYRLRHANLEVRSEWGCNGPMRPWRPRSRRRLGSWWLWSRQWLQSRAMEAPGQSSPMIAFQGPAAVGPLDRTTEQHVVWPSRATKTNTLDDRPRLVCRRLS